MFDLTNQFGEGSIAPREEFEFRRTRKRGERKSKLSCTSSLPGRSGMAVSYHSFDRFREFESDRWNSTSRLLATGEAHVQRADEGGLS